MDGYLLFSVLCYCHKLWCVFFRNLLIKYIRKTCSKMVSNFPIYLLNAITFLLDSLMKFNFLSAIIYNIQYKYLLSLNTSFFPKISCLKKRRSKYRNYLYTTQLMIYLNHWSFHMAHIGLFCRVYFVFMFFFFLLKKVVGKWIDVWFTAVG